MIFPESCFIDSNIFLYLFLEKSSKKADEFLAKVKYGEIKGYINPIVVSEIFHKMATAEIKKNTGISHKEILELIKENPETIKSLKRTFKAIDEIFSYQGIKILEINKETVFETIKIAKENGLLFHDALIASTCKLNNIKNILTNDKDFERIESLNIIKVN